MASLLEIRQFRETGRLIREGRVKKQMSLLDLADLTGLTIEHIASLENGNHYVFKGDCDEFFRLANKCMEHLHIKPQYSLRRVAELQNQRSLSKIEIPRFLRKVI